ncbi:MAG: hypothetical protein KKD53_09325, partial [Proteobacteria bacterium]|nr:hypothetical protein [Pseudomonadota bacterium]
MQLPRKQYPVRPTPSFHPIIVALALLFFPVQALAFWPFTQDKPQKTIVETVVPVVAPPVTVNEAAALRIEIQGLASELFRNLADADPENGDLGQGVMICTFVELKKLSRTSSLGRYLAEQLMNEMQQR